MGETRPDVSSCGPQALEHGTGNCGPWAWLPPGVWDLPGSGIRLCLLHWQVDSQPLNHQGSRENISADTKYSVSNCKYTCKTTGGSASPKGPFHVFRITMAYVPSTRSGPKHAARLTWVKPKLAT